MNVELLTVSEGTHCVVWQCIWALAAFGVLPTSRVDTVIVPKVAAIQFAGSAQWFERCNWQTGSAAPRLEVTRSSGH